MAEKVVSPGVFTNEIDQTFLPAVIGEIGAALVGPTPTGPPLIPTIVNTISEFESIFGTVEKSGSQSYTYLTNIAARNYLKNGSNLLVTRIMDGDFDIATANIPTGSGAYYTGSSTIEGGVSASVSSSLATTYSSSVHSFTLNTIGYGTKMNNWAIAGDSDASHSIRGGSVGGLDGSGKNQFLYSGSKDNVRWEISSVNPKQGTFSLLIRQGNDTHKRKRILETWNNLSLDPTQPNYISKVIGDSKPIVRGTVAEPYIQMSGSYPNKSDYVFVKNVPQLTNYLDAEGNVNLETNPNTINSLHISSSLPGLGSGSIHGAFTGGADGHLGFDSLGNLQGTAVAVNWYENIGAQTQGYTPSDNSTADGGAAYHKALNLLKNQDEYDFNMLLIPGIIGATHTVVAQKAIDVCEDRGDAFLILDPVVYDSALKTATTQAESRDSNYAAMYWPWVQIPDPQLGRNVWVPPSTVLGGIYAFNDKVAHPWFAPAGLNRGGIDNAFRAERKLTQSNRDDLYEANVNPIATFPGQGVCVWGQKTLQKKSSALDRVNVRRLLIRVKKFIASSSRFLVFEQNTVSTRNKFLSIVNPFMEQIQANSGLSAFRVIMDETNNTPDTIDRNLLIGQIFVQPTRTAEFIVLDFTVQPTGATFPE